MPQRSNPIVQAGKSTLPSVEARGHEAYEQVATLLSRAEQRVSIAEAALRAALSRQSDGSLLSPRGRDDSDRRRAQQVPPPGSVIRAYMFGPFRVCRHETCINTRAFAGRQTRHLLQILMAHRGRVVPSDALLEALWRERLPGDAKANLSVLVSRARKALGDQSLIACSSGGYVYLDDDRTWVDVEAFRDNVMRGRLSYRSGNLRAALQSFRSARDLWRGEPLVEHLYSDWAQDFHQQISLLYKEVLEGIAATALDLRLFPAAAQAASQLIAHDRFDDAGYLLLLRVLSLEGKQGEATQVLTEWRRWLKAELGISPPPEALELVRGTRPTDTPNTSDQGQHEESLCRANHPADHLEGSGTDAFDQMANPVFVAGGDEDIVYMNTAAANLVGLAQHLSDAPTDGISLADAFGQEWADRYRTSTEVLRAAAGGSPCFLAFHAVIEKWMEWTASACGNRGVVLIGRDVTGLSETLQQLRDATAAVEAARSELGDAVRTLAGMEAGLRTADASGELTA